MIIKESDDKARDIELLTALLSHPKANPETRSLIEREIRNMRAGQKGEKDAAYELDFYLRTSKNWAIIHDLRIEHNGRVAQIDHILINRLMDIWVLESKRFVEGIAVNDRGECAMFWKGRPQGIASPYEQNQKHILVL